MNVLKTTAAIVTVVMLALVLSTPQTTLAQGRNFAGTQWQIKPQAIPTTAKDVSDMGTGIPVNRDLYVCQLDIIIKKNAGVVNVTITDKQDTPVPFLDAVPFESYSATQGASIVNLIRTPTDQGCRWFPGGVTISADAVGAVVYMSGKY